MKEILNYINYLIEFFNKNQETDSKPLRFEEMYQYQDEVADRIYELLGYVKNSK